MRFAASSLRRLTLHDIGAFASSSFTGVRIGLTAAKGLTEAVGRKVVAVSNLQALAWFGTRPLRVAIIDALRGEIYGAVFNSSLRPVRDEVVTPFEPWLASLPDGDLEIITYGFEFSHAVPFPFVAARALAPSPSSPPIDSRRPGARSRRNQR